jgi:hypothetical protein
LQAYKGTAYYGYLHHGKLFFATAEERNDIVAVALQDIQPDEELTYFYNWDAVLSELLRDASDDDAAVSPFTGYAGTLVLDDATGYFAAPAMGSPNFLVPVVPESATESEQNGASHDASMSTHNKIINKVQRVTCRP